MFESHPSSLHSELVLVQAKLVLLAERSERLRAYGRSSEINRFLDASLNLLEHALANAWVSRPFLVRNLDG